MIALIPVPPCLLNSNCFSGSGEPYPAAFIALAVVLMALIAGVLVGLLWDMWRHRG